MSVARLWWAHESAAALNGDSLPFVCKDNVGIPGVGLQASMMLLCL